MSKKITKLVCMAMAAATVLGASACGGLQSKTKKVGADTLALGIVNKGYGTDWLTEMVKGFRADTGKKAEIVRKDTNTQAQTILETGYKISPIDLYFDVEGFNVTHLIAKSPKPIMADLSDIYDDPLDGYGETGNTLNDLLYPFFKETVTYYLDGKQYGVPWALGSEGIVYNADLFTKNNLSVPRTTTEMFKLFDDIKALKLKNQGDTVYPFIYSSSAYSEYLSTTWWVQYEGLTEYYNYLEGWCTEHEMYDSCGLKQTGRLKATQVVERIYKRANEYTNSDCPNYAFTKAQSLFLDGLAFMMPNGDWVEREMESGSIKMPDVRFMKMPVISDIVSKLPQKSFSDDATLCAVIDYVDGKSATAPAGVHEDDIAYIRTARSISMSETGHAAFVPIESPKQELAKDFLKYMLSAKGQNIMMKYSKGNRVPLDVDVSSYEAYAGLSNFGQSKQTLISGANMVGRHYYTKMCVLGGLQIWNIVREAHFGLKSDSSSYKSALTIFNEEFDLYDSKWEDMLDSAGIKNSGKDKTPPPAHLTQN